MEDAPEIAALKEAISIAGSTYKLADLLRQHRPITQSAVAQWDRVPAERVLDVEAVTGVSRYRLRPDIYGPSEAAA